MSHRISLFDEDDETPSPAELESLMEEMETILHMKGTTNGPWHARARGAFGYGTGPNSYAAMRAALTVRRKEKEAKSK